MPNRPPTTAAHVPLRSTHTSACRLLVCSVHRAHTPAPPRRADGRTSQVMAETGCYAICSLRLLIAFTAFQHVASRLLAAARLIDAGLAASRRKLAPRARRGRIGRAAPRRPPPGRPPGRAGDAGATSSPRGRVLGRRRHLPRFAAPPARDRAARLWRIARGRELPLATAAWFAGAACLGPLAALVAAYWRRTAFDRSVPFALVAGALALAFAAARPACAGRTTAPGRCASPWARPPRRPWRRWRSASPSRLTGGC